METRTRTCGIALILTDGQPAGVSQTPPASGRLDELVRLKGGYLMPLLSFCSGRRRNPEGVQIG